MIEINNNNNNNNNKDDDDDDDDDDVDLLSAYSMYASLSAKQ